jgi:DNA-binding LacI/PurR family transcriptional regulator
VNRLTIAVEALRACAELGLNIADDIGARSARMLLDRISGRSGQSEDVLRPELIVRQSAPRTRDPSRTNTGGEDT